MKNKKWLMPLIALVMALALIGCGPAEQPNNNDSNSNNDNTEQNNTPQDQPQTPTAPTVNYDGNMADWIYAPDAADDVTSQLVAIDTAEYGTAGSSLKQTLSAVSLMRLAALSEEELTPTLTAYLAGMNDTQRDYFSFQWQMAHRKAAAMLADPEGSKGLMETAGITDFDLGGVDTTRLDAIKTQMTDLLNGHGVTDQWKQHADREPFIHMGA